MNKLLVDGIYAANIVKLKDIAEKRTTKNIDGLVTETFTNSAENGIISQSDFFDRTITNDKNISGYFIVEPDDFVYNPRISTFAPVGPINRNKLGRSGVMSPLYLVFHTHDVEPEYLEWYFKSNAWHQFMRDNGNTGARSDRFSISDAEFFNMPIPIPPVEVQKTIARTLTTLDTKVILEKNEVEKFQNLKSAMLTKMFPKKGENVPEIRFPGFTDAWEQRKLGDVCEIKDSARIPNSEWTESGVPYIRASDVTNENIDGVLFISQERYEFYKNRTGAPTKDDVLFNGGGEIGKCLLIADENPIYVQGGAVLYACTSESSKLVGQYLKIYFETTHAKSYIDTASAGGTMKHFTLKPSQMMPILIPSVDEQEKLGTYFFNLDHLITLHQRKYEKLIDTKKAFLEKLIGGEK